MKRICSGILSANLAAAIMLGLSTGCDRHDHVQVEVVDGQGLHHKGYYDENRAWHGGYYDEHNTFHDDPQDWHR